MSLPVKRPVSIGGLLLCWLFLSYYGSTTLFYHVHFEPDGAIVHSHPIWTSPDTPTSHHHSRTAYQTIQQLSLILLIIGWGISLPPLFRAVYTRRFLLPLPRAVETDLTLHPWRAPPLH